MVQIIKKEKRRIFIQKDNYEKMLAIVQYRKLRLSTICNMAIRQYIYEEATKIVSVYRSPTTIKSLRDMKISDENIKILIGLGLPVSDMESLNTLVNNDEKEKANKKK